MAIFIDMVEDIMKVFMDDLSIVRDSFDDCLGNLKKVLRRCIDINLMLNREKYHFTIQESTIWEHPVSNKGIKVDCAKIGVTEKLPPPTLVKAIRSFLGRDGFY